MDESFVDELLESDIKRFKNIDDSWPYILSLVLSCIMFFIFTSKFRFKSKENSENPKQKTSPFSIKFPLSIILGALVLVFTDSLVLSEYGSAISRTHHAYFVLQSPSILLRNRTGIENEVEVEDKEDFLFDDMDNDLVDDLFSEEDPKKSLGIDNPGIEVQSVDEPSSFEETDTIIRYTSLIRTMSLIFTTASNLFILLYLSKTVKIIFQMVSNRPTNKCADLQSGKRISIFTKHMTRLKNFINTNYLYLIVVAFYIGVCVFLGLFARLSFKKYICDHSGQLSITEAKDEEEDPSLPDTSEYTSPTTYLLYCVVLYTLTTAVALTLTILMGKGLSMVKKSNIRIKYYNAEAFNTSSEGSSNISSQHQILSPSSTRSPLSFWNRSPNYPRTPHSFDDITSAPSRNFHCKEKITRFFNKRKNRVNILLFLLGIALAMVLITFFIIVVMYGITLGSKKDNVERFEYSSQFFRAIDCTAFAMRLSVFLFVFVGHFGKWAMHGEPNDVEDTYPFNLNLGNPLATLDIHAARQYPIAFHARSDSLRHIRPHPVPILSFPPPPVSRVNTQTYRDTSNSDLGTTYLETFLNEAAAIAPPTIHSLNRERNVSEVVRLQTVTSTGKEVEDVVITRVSQRTSSRAPWEISIEQTEDFIENV